MKKLFALSLAALMVMSMATVAFAATATLEGTVTHPTGTLSKNAVEALSAVGYLENTDNVVETDKATAVTMVAPGKTVYFPLYNLAAPTSVAGTVVATEFVTLSDAVKSVSVSTKYTLGQDLVDSIKIVYKKSADGYAYMLAVAFKASTSTASRDFAADVTLKKSSGTDKTDSDNILGFEGKWKIETTVAYTTAGIVTADAINDLTVKSSYKVFNFKDGSDEQTLEFEKFDGAYFEVDVTGQDKILIKADAKYDATVAGKYPAANINFFNGYNATFNKIGELRIPAEPDSFIYAINADGSLKAVKAEYDDGEECFVITTRTLGYYAISDIELDIAASVVEPSTAPAPVEPSAPVVEPDKKPPVDTGAAA